ncbi:Uma2 family endonuclease [Streptomyces sp. GC420]|uniref:Uma2 family endonuclease n=1 Tax=Streptomyces sp. GC420 TaxID=2697568 RepID=UPI0014152A1F|nr:Uma2 family endonuclease [Streptomyces sp. GC420]NBM16190.1 Uma2 family endonuclease [Streptomyces sp. GC420]
MAVIQHERELTIGEAADQLSRALPGHRVEILQGRLTVTPPADGARARSLTWLTEEFFKAGARGKAGVEYVQAIGLWLPSGPDDYAIPDFSVVEDDFLDALVEKNCYAPHVFRMVLEVTSSNWSDDLGPKVNCYAQAGVPVYVVADRRHDRVVVYTDPKDGDYQTRSTYKRGTSVPLPPSVGVEPELSADRLLDSVGRAGR